MSVSKIILGMHSFRCSEALVGGLYGVQFTRIGYAGGVLPNPTYNNPRDYTEVVEVHYDTEITTLSNILQVFFDNHDYATVRNKRFASSVFFTDQKQQEETNYFMSHMLEEKPVTVVEPLLNYCDAEHRFHKYYLQNTPKLMLQLLYEYNWDWKTWFSEFNVLPFVTKLNSALSGLFPMEYVDQILDSINVPDNIKLECRLRAARIRPQCLLS